MPWRIVHDGDDPVIGFAADELSRYLKAMDDAREILLFRAGDLRSTPADALVLSASADLLPDGADPVFDDAV